MTIKKGKVVTMHYTLKNDAGDIIDSSKGKEPMPFLQGFGNIIPGLEKALEGKKTGDSCDISVKPEDAYGEYHKEAIQEIPKDALKNIPNLKVGMELQSQDEKGNAFIVRVKEIKDDFVTVDGNHPLAGEILHFSVSVEDIKNATKEELEHGHVHSGSCSH